MPELPEVETTRRGITPHISGKPLTHVLVTQPQLRYPVPTERLESLLETPLVAITRRAKYLLLHFNRDTLIVHLGMSGSLRITTRQTEWRKHDHWQLTFGEIGLRYHDPRRFGFLLASERPETHPLIAKLGPEPLSDAFTPSYLHEQLQKRKSPVKTAIMNNELVVGIGNIYACESLFLANIHPMRPANRINTQEAVILHQHIQHVLTRSIQQGGSTLKDFLNPNGQPGYFAQTLHVYGRAQAPCDHCHTPIDNLKLAGRSSFFCPQCQPLSTKPTS